MKKKEKQIKQPKQEKKGFQFADWDYDAVAESIPDLPASRVGYWAWQVRGFFRGVRPGKAFFLKLFKLFLVFAVVSAASYYFNIFFWAWINDSM